MGNLISYHEAKEREKQMRRLAYLPFTEWWLLYIGVSVVAALSIFAGLYLGLSPDKDGVVRWENELDLARRIFFSIFYMIMFFMTAEAAFLFWLDKLIGHDVDENKQASQVQLWTSRLMIALSVFAMIVTSAAASQILAAWLGMFQGDAEFPVWTQGWILQSIPFLLILHIIAATIYRQSTAEADLERWRKAQMRAARVRALTAGVNAYVEVFESIAPKTAEKMYSERAIRDAKKLAAELGIWREEKRVGRDDGDGHIGRPPEDGSKNF